MQKRIPAANTLWRGSSLVEVLAVIGAVSFLMWLIVGVFQMSASFTRGVKSETEVIQATSRLSQQFRSDVHLATKIEWSQGGPIKEFKPNPASLPPQIPRLAPDGDFGREVPLPAAAVSPPAKPAYDSPPEPSPQPEPGAAEDAAEATPKGDADEELTDEDAAGKLNVVAEPVVAQRNITRLELTMQDGGHITYTTTPAGLQRSEFDAAGKLVRSNTTRMAPAAIATLELSSTYDQPLAVLWIDFLVPRPHRKTGGFESSRRLRIEAAATLFVEDR